MTTNDYLRMELRDAQMNIRVLKHTALRAQEEQKQAVYQSNYAHAQLATVIQERDAAKAKLEPIQAHLEKRIKELIQEHSAQERAEARCAELERMHSAAVAQTAKFANDLISERTAHNKLKALCNERGFGTPLFYTPPTKSIDGAVRFHTKHQGTIKMFFSFCVTPGYLDDLMCKLGAVRWEALPVEYRVKPEPKSTWSVEFFNNGIPLGTIIYSYAPTNALLNSQQEALKATSWKLTYSND